jgi:hypothetical protein
MLKRTVLALVAVLALTVPAWGGVIVSPAYEGEPPPQGFVVVVINGQVFFASIDN